MFGIKTYSILKDYSIDKNLGFGTYAEVKLGMNKKTSRLVAIKKLPLAMDD